MKKLICTLAVALTHLVLRSGADCMSKGGSRCLSKTEVFCLLIMMSILMAYPNERSEWSCRFFQGSNSGFKFLYDSESPCFDYKIYGVSKTPCIGIVIIHPLALFRMFASFPPEALYKNVTKINLDVVKVRACPNQMVHLCACQRVVLDAFPKLRSVDYHIHA